jgi:hypothetical protein
MVKQIFKLHGQTGGAQPMVILSNYPLTLLTMHISTRRSKADWQGLRDINFNHTLERLSKSNIQNDLTYIYIGVQETLSRPASAPRYGYLDWVEQLLSSGSCSCLIFTTDIACRPM